MGREIRKVPPNWEHPLQEGYLDRFQPMYDQRYEDARKEWLDGLAAHKPEDHDGSDYWEYDPPPDREMCRPWKDEDATWFQLWETVSDGTPVSPPFETLKELADYLVENGDFLDQKRGDGGWNRESADRFVEVGWAPSGAVVGGRWVESKDIPAVLGKKEA